MYYQAFDSSLGGGDFSFDIKIFLENPVLTNYYKLKLISYDHTNLKFTSVLNSNQLFYQHMEVR